MASTYLTRTNTSTSDTWTFSAWVKKATAASNGYLISWGTSGANGTGITFDSNSKLSYYSEDGGSNRLRSTSAVYRDTSAWYHVVVKSDANAITLYVNGEEPTQAWSNGSAGQNLSSSTMTIGRWAAGTLYHDGSMAHVHFIDGTAYTPSTFGETDATTGIWKPKTAPSVTYGTNGFFLKFENSGAFGTDSSGNANTFTVNGTMTQNIDTPSNVFATLNPLNQTTSNNFVLSNGNTTTITSGDASAMYYGGSSTLGASSGKWYCEFKSTSNGGNVLSGISSNPSEDARLNNYIGEGSYAYGYYAAGTSWNNNSSSSYGDTYTDNDIIGIAMDLDNSKLYFSKNGVWQNSGDPTSGATGTGAISITANETYFFSFGDQSSTPKSTININFGNGYFGTTAVSSAQNPDDGIGIFEYDVPTGYYALNTKAINAQEYD